MTDNRLVAIKILGNLSENYEVIEEEYRIFKDLSRHDNFPHFYGAYLNKFDKEIKDEIWLVMEVNRGRISLVNNNSVPVTQQIVSLSIVKVDQWATCCTT